MIIETEHRVIVQGITGAQGTYWTEQMQAYGTTIIGGVNPRKPGIEHLGVPVFASAVEAAETLGRIDVSVLFVPPAGALAAVGDAIEAGIRLVVVLTEFIPVHDTMTMIAMANECGCRIIGPNTAGTVTPGQTFVGFMPAFDDRIFRPGRIGVVSRSGSLGTLTALELTRAGYGQSAFVGIGGDPVSGTTTLEAVAALDTHRGTDAIVIIGEIGGRKEEDAAMAVAACSKPVVSFIAGAAAPVGTRMGHAGAIIEGTTGTHSSKKAALVEAGAIVVDVPWEIPGALAVCSIGPDRKHQTEEKSTVGDTT